MFLSAPTPAPDSVPAPAPAPVPVPALAHTSAPAGSWPGKSLPGIGEQRGQRWPEGQPGEGGGDLDDVTLVYCSHEMVKVSL